MPHIELINPPELPAPVGYAHATISEGWVWLGGQISVDASGELLFPGDIAAQFGQAMRNIAVVLRTAGCGPEDVVKLTYFVTDVAAYRAALKDIGSAYRAVFGRHYPASSLIEVTGLFEPLALIEIEGVARQPESQ